MKTSKLLSSMLLLALSMITVSCIRTGSVVEGFGGERITEDRHLTGFEKIEINGSPTVYYTQADNFSVTVEGTAKGVENILTEVSGGTLSIRNRGKMGVVNIVFNEDDEATVHISSPDLIGVTLNGSGDFISNGRIDSDNMAVMLKGSGDIDIKDLICDRCQVELVGSGDIDLKCVETKTMTASLVGSGDIDLRLLNTTDTRLYLKGSGDIDADFSRGCQSVECELRGSGDISLKGEVRHFSQQKSGSGDVDIEKLTVQ